MEGPPLGLTVLSPFIFWRVAKHTLHSQQRIIPRVLYMGAAASRGSPARPLARLQTSGLTQLLTLVSHPFTCLHEHVDTSWTVHGAAAGHLPHAALDQSRAPVRSRTISLRRMQWPVLDAFQA